MSTQCAVCQRVLYEVSPELLERSLSDVAVGLMLEDSSAFGLYFDFIAELHTDSLSLPPKIVFNDHSVQKQNVALSQSTILRYFSRAFPLISSLERLH